MRSSKWLVFIRSRLAGFDRSLTQVPGGYAMPITFAGKSERVIVRVRNLPDLEKLAAEVLHPGGEKSLLNPATYKKGVLELQVPLVRGCAMVRLEM
jgi:hypothetical protein